MAPTTLASNSSDMVSAGCSTSRGQDIIEPMDTETQEDRRASADQNTGGKKNTEVDGRMQGDGTQTTQRTQADRKTQVDVVTEESERSESGRISQEDVMAQGKVGTQAGERTQADRRVQEDKGTWSEGSIPTAVKCWSEEVSMTGISPQSRAPKRPPSEDPRSPQIIECFEQTPEEFSVPDKAEFMLRSEEAAGTASGNREETVPGPLAGGLMRGAQLPPEGSLEQVGGERCRGPEQSGPVKDKAEEGLSQGPKQEQPREVPPVDLGGCPPAGLSPQVPTLPSLPGAGLTDNSQQRLPSTAASQHMSTAAFLPSGDKASLSSAPPLHLGPGTPSQSHPPGTRAADAEGACAKVPGVEGRTSGPQTCDPGLIDSLKSYLLLLLKLSSSETSARGPGAQGEAAAGDQAPSPSLAPTVEVAGLSPRTSRRILERVENNRLVQSAQTLLLSPCTSRRLTGLLDREVQVGCQALAAARCPGPSPLSVPAIVVGEEEGSGLASGGSSEGEGEVSLEGPGLPTSQESGMGGPLGGVGGQAAPGQGLLSAESRAREPFREEEIPGEAPTDLPAATPEELALGARRKRFLPKVRAAGDGEPTKPKERESPSGSPQGPRKGLAPGNPGREKHSPTQGRKGGLLEVPRAEEEPAAGALGSSPRASNLEAELALEEGKQGTSAKPRRAKDLLKAPQVIRKIRVEQFPDASGSLKLWCQFFNILSDSVLTWAKDQRPVGEVGRSAGDEGPAALAIVQASPVDCGVYRCTIRNEHGSASTDFCLSPEDLPEDSGFLFSFSTQCCQDSSPEKKVKASQAKVIYGLEPIFESGLTCIIKVSSLLVFGPSSETSLLGRNYDVTIQGCKIQNMSREYCKIFAAEARAAPGFGDVPEIIPLYLIYRPANNIPYATLEEDLGKPMESYCSREWGFAAAPAASSSSEAVQKCQTFQHWLYLWTNGSFLVTDLAGVNWKMTDVQIATKLRGYQGLKESCFPALLDQFASSHQCNTFCEMLGLKPLKGPEAAHPQAKAKGSKSPSAGRRGPQLSPQPQRKGPPSPQKSAPSSKATPHASEAVATQLLGQPPIQDGGSKAQGMR
ncbi:alpha-protein kinase 3 [Pontoporia blainvillei]|uniref:non-specific serine/threonine protein kinase n=1 Tax=Pontoporia blainvillei TaxID=48723 RepID=A0ABX0S6H2_PONBL|nr:alpha-protein kinase 3 [Pontoporia blainvillei]